MLLVYLEREKMDLTSAASNLSHSLTHIPFFKQRLKKYILTYSLCHYLLGQANISRIAHFPYITVKPLVNVTPDNVKLALT